MNIKVRMVRGAQYVNIKTVASRHQIDMSKVYALNVEFSIIELLMISLINLFTS